MTYGEAFENEYFKTVFKEEIALIEDHRKKILMEHPKAVFKRSAYDDLTERGLLVEEYMVNEFFNIQRKLSNNSYKTREWIFDFMLRCARRVVLHHEAVNKPAPVEVVLEAPKKKRAKKSAEK